MAPVAALSGFALLLVLQLIPGFGEGGAAVSIDPFQTRRYLLTTLVYLGAWLLVLLTVRSPERLVRLLTTILAAGVLQAIAAVLLYSTRSTYQLWGAEFDQGTRATGTFVSPDNLAGYLELCIAAGSGWLVSQLGGATPGDRSHWRTKAVAVLEFLMSGKMLLRLWLVVLVIALVMTHSRMGNGVFFLSLAFIGAIVAVMSKQLRQPAMWLVASIVVVDVVLIGQLVGLDRVVQRIQDTSVGADTVGAGFAGGVPPPQREESLAQRLEVPLLSLQLVQQRPWFGHGGGTYITAFPPFKRAGLELQWDKAHNDYVQVAADTGLVGVLLWLLVGLSTALRARPLLRDGGSLASRGVGVAALMALFCMGLHSMVDFNLHIPSNALTFTVLLAAVWAVVPAQKRRRRRSGVFADPATEAAHTMAGARWRRWQAGGLVVLLLPVTAWVVYEAQRNLRADVVASAAKLQIAAWVTGATAPASASAADWDRAQAALQNALAITSDDPTLHADMGDLQVVAGQRDWADGALRRQHFADAATSYVKAIALRDRDPRTWAMLALAYQVAGANRQQVHAAWAKALELGPFEGHVQPVLMQIVLADWDGAAPAMRTWATRLFDDGSESKRNGINAMAGRYGLRFDPDATTQR